MNGYRLKLKLSRLAVYTILRHQLRIYHSVTDLGGWRWV